MLLRILVHQCLTHYLTHFPTLFHYLALTSGETGSGWMMNRLKDNTKFFYNIDSGDHAWTRGTDIIKDYSLLNKEDIQVSLFFNKY